MQDRPNYDELLEAVASFLTNDVMANSTGRTNFHARVAANVVEMVRRELGSQERDLPGEWAGLDALLGMEDRPSTITELRDRLHVRNTDLAQRIRDGQAVSGAFRQSVLTHLRRVTREKLAVTNPAWSAEERV